MIDMAPELTLRRAEAIRASVHATERDARTHALAQALSLISRGQDLRTLSEREGAEVARAYVEDAEGIIDRNPHLLSLPERERLNLI
jgi:hypothetical protein